MFNAVGGRNVRRPEGAIVIAIAPDPADQTVQLIRSKISAFGIEPIFLHRRLFGGVQIDAEVSYGVIPRDRTPVDER